MKKVMVFVLSLMIGLVLSLLFGLTSLIKKIFTSVRQQVILSKKRGDFCLRTLNEAQTAFVTGLKFQAKKHVLQTKATLQHSKEQGVSYVKNMQKTQADMWSRLGFKGKEIFFQMNQQLRLFVQKGAFYMNKMTSLFVGLMTGVVLTMMFSSKPVDVAALVDSTLESKLAMVEETAPLAELPHVFDSVFATTTMVDLPSIQEEQLSTIEVETQIEATISSTETVEEMVQEETTEIQHGKFENQTSSTTAVKPTEKVEVELPKETVETQTTPVKEPVKPNGTLTEQTGTLPEVVEDNELNDSSSDQSVVIETPEKPETPVLMPGESISGDLIINESLIEEMVPAGGVLLPSVE